MSTRFPRQGVGSLFALLFAGALIPALTLPAFGFDSNHKDTRDSRRDASPLRSAPPPRAFTPAAPRVFTPPAPRVFAPAPYRASAPASEPTYTPRAPIVQEQTIYRQGQTQTVRQSGYQPPGNGANGSGFIIRQPSNGTMQIGGQMGGSMTSDTGLPWRRRQPPQPTGVLQPMPRPTPAPPTSQGSQIFITTGVPGDHISLPSRPGIQINQPNYYPQRPYRHHHDDDDDFGGPIIVGSPYPVYSSYPYGYPYSYPYGYPYGYPYPVSYPYPDPPVVYAPEQPQVIVVPEQPQVVYVPQAPVVVDPGQSPSSANPSANSNGSVIVEPEPPVATPEDAAPDVPERAATPALPPGAEAAIVDLQEGWVLADASLIEKHVDPHYRIRIYSAGKLDHTATSKEYLDLTHKALGVVITQSFVLDQRTVLPDGRVRACGKHVFYDGANHRQAVLVCYWLQSVDGRWLVTAIDSRPYPQQTASASGEEGSAGSTSTSSSAPPPDDLPAGSDLASHHD